MTGLEVGAIAIAVVVGIVVIVWAIRKIFWEEFI